MDKYQNWNTKLNNTYEEAYNDKINIDNFVDTDHSLIGSIRVIDPKEYRTSRGTALYFVAQEYESATTVPPKNYQVYEELKDLILNCSKESVEDELSPFIAGIKRWIEKYGIDAVLLLKFYMKSSYSDSNIIADMMEVIGEANEGRSYIERKLLLESFVRSSNSKIRYGAVVGLANINSKSSINLLHKAFVDEEVPLIKNTIKSVINYLKDGK